MEMDNVAQQICPNKQLRFWRELGNGKLEIAPR